MQLVTARSSYVGTCMSCVLLACYRLLSPKYSVHLGYSTYIIHSLAIAHLPWPLVRSTTKYTSSRRAPHNKQTNKQKSRARNWGVIRHEFSWTTRERGTKIMMLSKFINNREWDRVMGTTVVTGCISHSCKIGSHLPDTIVLLPIQGCTGTVCSHMR